MWPFTHKVHSGFTSKEQRGFNISLIVFSITNCERNTYTLETNQSALPNCNHTNKTSTFFNRSQPKAKLLNSPQKSWNVYYVDSV